MRATNDAVLITEPPPAGRSAGMPELAAQEHALGVDFEREVPDRLVGRDGIVVLGVHDAGVVEQHVQPAEGFSVS